MRCGSKRHCHHHHFCLRKWAQEAFLNKQVRSGNKIEFGQLTKPGNTLEPAMGGQPCHMPLYPTLAGSSPPVQEELTLKSHSIKDVVMTAHVLRSIWRRDRRNTRLSCKRSLANITFEYIRYIWAHCAQGARSAFATFFSHHCKTTPPCHLGVFRCSQLSAERPGHMLKGQISSLIQAVSTDRPLQIHKRWVVPEGWGV